VFEGGADNDTLQGESGLDTLYGDAGNDTFFGGADADKFDGGSKTGDTGDLHDIVDYSDVTANGVKVDLTAGTATGDGNDTILNIEDIRGSTKDDTLSGNSGINTIYGGADTDILSGQAGADLLYGETGDDTLMGDAGADELHGGDALGVDGLVSSKGLKFYDASYVWLAKSRGCKLYTRDKNILRECSDVAMPMP